MPGKPIWTTQLPRSDDSYTNFLGNSVASLKSSFSPQIWFDKYLISIWILYFRSIHFRTMSYWPSVDTHQIPRASIWFRLPLFSSWTHPQNKAKKEQTDDSNKEEQMWSGKIVWRSEKDQKYSMDKIIFTTRKMFDAWHVQRVHDVVVQVQQLAGGPSVCWLASLLWATGQHEWEVEISGMEVEGRFVAHFYKTFYTM